MGQRPGSEFRSGSTDDGSPPLGYAPVILQQGLNVGRAIVGTVRAIAIAGSLTQTEALRERLKARPRVEIDTEDNDNTRVVKVQDAIKCVQDFFSDVAVNDPDTFTDMIDEVIARVLIGQITGDVDLSEPLKVLAEKIAACIRSKALPQDSARARVTYTYSKREI